MSGGWRAANVFLPIFPWKNLEVIAMIRRTIRKLCSLVLCFVLLWGILFIPPTLYQSAEAAAPSFNAGFESTEAIQPNWENESKLATMWVKQNLRFPAKCANLVKSLAFQVKPDTRSAYAYNKMFEVSIPVKPNTTLSYWIYPQSRTTHGGIDLNHGRNSTYVAVDLALKMVPICTAIKLLISTALSWAPKSKAKAIKWC